MKISIVTSLFKSTYKLDFDFNSLIFRPSKVNYHKSLFPKHYKEVFIKTQDGETLHGYFIPASIKTDKVMLYLHGNDKNVSRWHLGPANIQDHVSVNALIVDYRGYGKSTGTPSYEGVINDALAMYQYLIDNGYKDEDISLYGRSLGGAVALELASRVKVRSVVVQSSFYSMSELIKEKNPALPKMLIPKDVFNSARSIKKINVPILISHGTNDNLVPIQHAHRLYADANEPKELIVLNGAGHEHLKKFFTREYFEALRKLFT